MAHNFQEGFKQFAGGPEDEEPRYLAVIALLAVGGLYLALPRTLTFGPRWLLLTVVAVLLVPTIIARRTDHHRLNRFLGLVVVSIVTLSMIVSVALLIHYLPAGKEKPLQLLQSATALWLTNILVFALWYWNLDAGGPRERDLRPTYVSGAFLFPQMTMTIEDRQQAGQENWTPGFVDYLFLAFNTSTALSPADTAVMARWAKVMMMLQATISLTVIALLAARAVNILSG